MVGVHAHEDIGDDSHPPPVARVGSVVVGIALAHAPGECGGAGDAAIALWLIGGGAYPCVPQAVDSCDRSCPRL